MEDAMKVLVGPNNFNLHQVITDLADTYPEVEWSHCTDRNKLAEALSDAEVFFGWLGRDEFLAAKRLRWIQSPSSGVDYYCMIPELVESDVLLTSARGTHGACLAESALAMILAFTRGIVGGICEQRKRHWANRELRPGVVELTGMTLGIVGLGVVGRALAERAKAFGMRIIAVDKFASMKPDYVERVDGLDGLKGMLHESDFVVVTVPRTPETIGMLGTPELAQMKPSAILIGISRGRIIDEEALRQALIKGTIAAAGLDVVAQEPLPEESPLWELENLIITPHIAGGSQHESGYIREIFTDNLGRFLRGELPLRNQVDKQRGF
jgi:phosphoglycerate dehydrogenase-like enzyme